MIYKFKSKAAGDVIMLAQTGDKVLGLIGKPSGAKGIIEPADMPAAMHTLAAAIEADEAQRQQAQAAGEPPSGGEAISLRQRAWPLVEMMKRSHAADAPIVWGA
jgi:phage-related baseplate assembly protein